MGKRKVVMDKIYYLSRLTRIPKNDWPDIFDVSETALRKWSYNPENVSEDLRKKIEEYVKVFVLSRVKVRYIPEDPVYSQVFELAKMKWSVTVNGANYITDTSHVGRFIRLLLSEELEYVRYLEETAPWYKRKNTERKLNDPIWHIVSDTRLEMPVGVTNWDESLNKEEN